MAYSPVTLAHTYNPDKHTVTNWLWSEKLDGVRAYLTKSGKLFSRNDKPIHAPKWFIDSLHSYGQTLDGELFLGRGLFQRCVSIVRKQKPIDSEWQGIRYIVFDCLDHPREPWYTRRTAIAPHLRHLHSPITDIESHLASVLSVGGEGIMLRNPNATYEFKRSYNLLKLKPSLTSSAIVVGYLDGKGKHEGLMGALRCELPNGVRFEVGTGFTDLQRKYPPKIGTLIVVAYQNLTDDGKPRFPVYKL